MLNFKIFLEYRIILYIFGISWYVTSSLDIKKCYLNINYVRQFFSVQTRLSKLDLNKQAQQGFEKKVAAIKNIIFVAIKSESFL